MPDHLRIYFFINTGTLSPTEQNWDDLINQAKLKPFSEALLAAAHACQNFISASKRSQGTGQVLKNTLCGVEIQDEQVDAMLVVLNAQAALRSVSGNAWQKAQGVWQGEIREAAIDLGYTLTQANKLTVSRAAPANYLDAGQLDYYVTLAQEMAPPGYTVASSFFDRYVAIALAQQYLADNSTIWYAPT